jgi:hypothetical protein
MQGKEVKNTFYKQATKIVGEIKEKNITKKKLQEQEVTIIFSFCFDAKTYT